VSGHWWKFSFRCLNSDTAPESSLALPSLFQSIKSFILYSIWTINVLFPQEGSPVRFAEPELHCKTRSVHVFTDFNPSDSSYAIYFQSPSLIRNLLYTLKSRLSLERRRMINPPMLHCSPEYSLPIPTESNQKPCSTNKNCQEESIIGKW
jgi:hypothetical protein